MKDNCYPEEFPGEEIATCCRFYVDGKSDVRDAEYASWISAGYFLKTQTTGELNIVGSTGVVPPADLEILAFADKVGAGAGADATDSGNARRTTTTTTTTTTDPNRPVGKVDKKAAKEIDVEDYEEDDDKPARNKHGKTAKPEPAKRSDIYPHTAGVRMATPTSIALPAWLMPLVIEMLKKFLSGQKASRV